ncbi:MAG: hypothetical protein K1X54_06105 [Flavobacteriales bacterium]|nr:hypothetical protein [Flavobacteriales bacterium]
MKTITTFLTVFALMCQLHAQQGSFTWIASDLFRSAEPVWGTMGVASSSNTPGSRESACIWIDQNDNIWIFGGAPEGYHGLNDLWKYDPTTQMWTWMKGTSIDMSSGSYGTLGVESATSRPGARFSAASWIDNDGNLWLFGGNKPVESGSAQFYNDLWKYNITTNNWTWMHGSNVINQNFVLGTKGIAAPGNTPCASSHHAYWKGNDGKFWLFGGIGKIYNVQGHLNQLWNFDPLTLEWTWVSGGNQSNQNPVWGSQGVFDEDNVPSSRASCAGWMDLIGNMYVYGGYGIRNQDNTVNDQMNDFWKYDPVSDQWAWINGSNTNGTSSTYGTKGIESVTNHPGSRADMAYWTDDAGDLWFFGGHSEYNGFGVRCDLWRLNTENHYWTYMHGSTTVNGIGQYGPQGTASTLYYPGARNLLGCTKDIHGDFWLIGGIGKDNNNLIGALGDVWKYDAVDATPPILLAVDQDTYCGDVANITFTGQHFTGAQIFIGENEIIPVSISDTEIIIQITPNTIGEILIINEFGQLGYNGASLSVNALVNMTVSACESYSLNDITYTSSGVYTQVLQSLAGCDSTIVLNLDITHTSSSTIHVEGCESVLFHEEIFTESGTYERHLLNESGCDSTIFLQVTIHPTIHTNWSTTSCGTFLWNDIAYETSGIYDQMLTSDVGCDSIVTLTLNIVNLQAQLSFDESTIAVEDNQGDYTWINCETKQEVGSNNNEFTPTQNGSYAVIITQGECEVTSECLDVMINDVFHVQQNQILIYPNPFQNELCISGPSGSATSAVLRDATGSMIADIYTIENNKVDTSSWPCGLYHLTLFFANTTPMMFTLIKHN